MDEAAARGAYSPIHLPRPRRPVMSVQDLPIDPPVPFRVDTDPEQYRLEQERIYKGAAWSYLCLAGEIANPGDWVATTVGEVAVIVARGADGRVNAFVNRCAHRGNLL